jgi:cell division protein FtsB
MEVPMAKRSKDSNHETDMVKVVDPFYDAPEQIHPELPPPPPDRPSFGQRVRRFFEVLLRLLALLIIIGIIGLGLYYGLPLLYQKYIVPVEQNTAEVTELQSRQEQTEEDVADLQTRLDAIESGQSEHAETLTDLEGRLSEIETGIAAHTKSLAALEQMQSELQAQDEGTSADLERQINMLKSMELISRARLFMYQSNFGLARQDIQLARDLLADVQRDAPETLADDLAEVIRRLDLTLYNLPDFPVAASDDLDIAWQILLGGLPPSGPGAAGTPVITVTPSSTPPATPTPGATVQPSATP